MLNKIKKWIYLYLQYGFKECAECNEFDRCDRMPFLHRFEEECNYGKVNGK